MSSWLSKLASSHAVLAYVNGPRDLLFILRVFAFAMTAPILLRLPLARLSALLEPSQLPPNPTQVQEDKITRTVLAVLRAGHPLVRRGCLTRGVTLYYFLRRAGSEVSLCFGMGASSAIADGFDGHCWLVKHGEPYAEARDPRPLYTRMCTFPWSPRQEPGA